jgi:hydrogenase maturation protein HypF
VARLRARKHREDRPFALMAPDLDAAAALARLGQAERTLLLGRERPIVLAPRRAGAPVAAAVAPRTAELGVMLPYSPLHHLLAADTATTLVMTSGNVADEPIAYRDDDARERLTAIADHVLLHDRPIRTRTDDSVVRAVGGRPLLLRRSRGHVPEALALPVAAPGLLACGAELKSTFCVAKGVRAWPGHHIGDLRNEETLRSFAVGVAHFERLFAVAPEVVAHDLHPDYLSTTYALAREGVTHVGVQHHHAHLAAVLAEHGERGPAIGAIYDGTGHGLDGSVWGGELLAGGLDGFERAGHLWPVRLPGGDRAVRQPWRMACAWLAVVQGAEPAPLPGIAPQTWHAVAELVRTGLAAPLTTSMGRLFDAVAALCGVRTEVGYEGQAAVELEAISDRAEQGAYPLDVTRGVLDARGTVAAVALEVAAGVQPSVVGARFHRAVARATAQACAGAAGARGLDTVVLAGGVWQNRLLLELTTALLDDAGLRVLVPERLPPNDGAISFGQAAVAAAQSEALSPPRR